ncbi:MAG: hypothetical protein ACI9N9_001016 [Enterobacterales bacterium]|jgi:hypothetical protein
MSYKKFKGLLLRITLLAMLSLLGTAVFADASIEDKQYIESINVGDWIGLLRVPNGSLRLWLVVERDPKGELQATLESVDQAPGKKMSVKDISFEENKLSFSIPRITAKYQGNW